MQKIITSFFVLFFFSSFALAQTTLFSDNFESGTTQWVFTGAWGLTELQAVSPTHSLTESPSGNYPPNQNITATMATGLDLSTYLGAEVSFWAKYDIEQGFDYMYLQVSTNGTTWITLEAFNAEGVPWTQYTYDLGGFVGNSDVKIRFRFFSDGGYEVDGMYIDDFTVTGSTVDLSPPLVVHTGPEFYEGVIGDFTASTTITDISGIQSATLKYSVDGGSPISLTPTSVVGDDYIFTIPSTIPGSNIEYYIEATDNQSNTTIDPPIYSFISGTYIKYDNPAVDFVSSFGPLVPNQLSAAVRMTIPAGNPGNLVTALIRNYTDVNRPNADMEFHVWADNGGVPGADLITPFMVTPEATTTNTSPMTRIDLRPYFNELSGLSGDFWIGFNVPQDTVWITIKQPGTALRSYTFDGGIWFPYTNTDFHFRCILGDERNLPVELSSFSAIISNGNVILNWTTKTELNNQGFEVERKLSEGQFITIGHIQGHGTTTDEQQYSYTDADVQAGNYSYRLKQVDFNGSYEYSNSIFVDVTAPLEFALDQNYPNPFNPTTTINFSLAEPTFVRLAIYNLLGEEVEVLKNEAMSAGSFEVSFDASSLPSGMYLYKIETTQFTSVRKMMLMK